MTLTILSAIVILIGLAGVYGVTKAQDSKSFVIAFLLSLSILVTGVAFASGAYGIAYAVLFVLGFILAGATVTIDDEAPRIPQYVILFSGALMMTSSVIYFVF